jgi:ATP-dependent Zn protease
MVRPVRAESWARRRVLPIDCEVKDIVETTHHTALAAIERNRDLLETVTALLLETEAIEGEKLHELLGRVQSSDISNRLNEAKIAAN